MKKLALVAALTVPSLAMAQAPAKPAPIDTSYTLKVEAPLAKKGQKSVAHIQITPGSGFHMNKEFPTSLSLNAPEGVTLDKQKLSSKDASRWEAEGGAFDVAYTALQPGKKLVTGEIKFAVCSATSCDPKKSQVSFEINVK
jgi:hypothetical protein